MKQSGLSPHLYAATLFLGAALRAEEAKPTAPALSTSDDAAATRRVEAVAAEVARRRALQSLRSDVIALFDRNGDGKLDGDEIAAVNRLLTGPNLAVVAKVTAAQESGRLEKVAAEVAERRAAREEAAKSLGDFRAVQAPGGTQDPTAADSEKARLARVAAEVARRRAEMEKMAAPRP
jgi:hypothetical protein